MSFDDPRSDLQLHRLEVHAGPHRLKDGEVLRWTIRVGRSDNDLVFQAYLGRHEVEGRGQAQAYAFRIGGNDASVASWSRDQAVEWGARYAFESLWDTCRRALQAQASLMDFQFELDTKAPVPELEVEEDSFSAAETIDSLS